MKLCQRLALLCAATLLASSATSALSAEADFEITDLELVGKGRQRKDTFVFPAEAKNVAVWVHYVVRDVGDGGDVTIEVSGTGPGEATIQTKRQSVPLKVGTHGRTGRTHFIKVLKPQFGTYTLTVKLIAGKKIVTKSTEFTIIDKAPTTSAATADFEIADLEIVGKGRTPTDTFVFPADRRSMAVWVPYVVRDIGPGGDITVELSGRGPGDARIATAQYKTPIKKGSHGKTGRPLFIKIVKPAEGKYTLVAKLFFHDKVVRKETSFRVTSTAAKVSAGNADFEITKLELVGRGRKPQAVYELPKDRHNVRAWVHYVVRDVGPGGMITVELSGTGPGDAGITTKTYKTAIRAGKHGSTGRSHPISFIKPASGTYTVVAKLIFHDKTVSKTATLEVKTTPK